jgi:hypothetical protein
VGFQDRVPAEKVAAPIGQPPQSSCARLYHGQNPNLPIKKIFGVTSFEFG